MRRCWLTLGLATSLLAACSARGSSGGGGGGTDGGAADGASLTDTGSVTPEDTGSVTPEDTGSVTPEDTGSVTPEDTGNAPRCGDSACNGDESCSSCPQDCGACAPRCGDGTCNGSDTCMSCPQDCGACAPRCGDGTCNGTETCMSCSQDCGACAARCGDGTCNGTETCMSCSQDCGACAPRCGDGTCNGTESCSTCASDCGACTPQCGDGLCTGAETCTTCRSDCGACATSCGNGQCDTNENCSLCPTDCGSCTQRCGDGVCTGTETCASCAGDCGACALSCRNQTSCGGCVPTEGCGWCSDVNRCVPSNALGGPTTGCTATNFVRSASLCGGTSSGGYARSNPVVTFVDACALSGAVRLIPNVDDTTGASALPFAFRYFGREFAAASALTVSPNGWFSFGTVSNPSIDPGIGQSTGVANAIAAQGRDLLTSTSGVCTAVAGVSGSRRFYVQWAAARTYSSTGGSGSFTFQIVLHEGTNLIDLVYQTMSPATAASVGLNGGAPQTNTLAGCTTNPCTISSGSVIRFTPTP